MEVYSVKEIGFGNVQDLFVYSTSHLHHIYLISMLLIQIFYINKSCTWYVNDTS